MDKILEQYIEETNKEKVILGFILHNERELNDDLVAKEFFKKNNLSLMENVM